VRFYDPHPATGWRRPLATGLAAIDTVAAWLIAAQVAVMVSVVSAQVALRYLVNSSIGWADEVSRLMFVWSIFLAIPLGVRIGGHIGVEMLTARLPAPVREVLARTVAAAGAALMSLVAWQALVITRDQWDEQMASVNASAALFILALGVGCAHSALHLAWIVLSGPPKARAGIATE
jgi:TRAP-type C4-dicarboxylate transport system permease small subunit